VGEDRERLWQRWRELDQNLEGYAARRPRETSGWAKEMVTYKAGSAV
jgi:F420H(2)-dependent quinone reductase